MKNLLSFTSFLLFLGAFQITQAQQMEFGPIDAEWTVNYRTPCANNNQDLCHASDLYEVADTITKNGKLCKVLIGNINPHHTNVYPNLQYFYQEGGKIYSYFGNNGMDTFQKIMDFDAPVGYSWNVYIDYNYIIDPDSIVLLTDTLKITIDSVYQKDLDGVLTPSYHYSLDHLPNITVSQEDYQNFNYSKKDSANILLGSSSFIFPFLASEFYITDVYPMNEFNRQICAYEDDLIDYENIQIPGLPYCGYEGLSVEEKEVENIELLIKDNVLSIHHLPNEKALFEITDIQGKTILTTQNTTISLDGLSKGIYFLIAEINGQKVVQKFVY
ncbi:MAG: T9SS type A sorting domain-containing protein [Flavobacteriales bacterium]|jgi:hypothetical protein|nr:T9SS type A sorting domain-containing protein [Flavobacteriales bacterium]